MARITIVRLNAFISRKARAVLKNWSIRTTT
jgi:hypothetical protein